MSELENIENVEEVETIPTDNTTEELQENVEQLKAQLVLNSSLVRKMCKVDIVAKSVALYLIIVTLFTISTLGA